jgi:hypothetical protein
VGVWGVPPAAGGKRKMVFRGLPRACWEFFLKSFNNIVHIHSFIGGKLLNMNREWEMDFGTKSQSRQTT